MHAHCRMLSILDGTRTRSLRLRRPTPYPLGHEDAVVLVTDRQCDSGRIRTCIGVRCGQLACACEAYKACVKYLAFKLAEISLRLRVWFWFLKGIRSPGAAGAADTRSIAVELLSRLACECLIALARADACFAARVPSSSVSQGAATRERTRTDSMYIHTQTRGCAAKRA